MISRMHQARRLPLLRLKRGFLCCFGFLFLTALFLAASPVFSQEINSDASAQAQRVEGERSLTTIVERPDEDLLIFSLVLGKTTIFDPLLTYEDLDTGIYYIPLADFAQGLEFPITVNDDQTRAEGWFLDEKRRFFLDLETEQAEVDGQRYDLKPRDVERHSDGIYISLELLQKWFPVTLEVEFSDLAVVVKSLEPLPIEVRQARDERRKTVETNTQYRYKEYPLQEVKPPAFSMPFVNTSAQTAYDTNDSFDEPLSGTATVLASGLFAGQDFDFSANTTTIGDENLDIRATLGRKDPTNNLFGLGLSEYKIGDVLTRPIALIANGNAGRGLSFSTNNLGGFRGVQSGFVELRGELPVGFQVDVMRNGQLLGFIEEPDENGEYVFNLDVFPGLNVFELVFFGPQGQKETREERFYIPANPIEKGRFDYKVELIQDDTNLFTNRENSDEDSGKFRGTVEAQYGLTGTSSFYGAASSVSVEGDRRFFGLARYSQSFKGIRSDLSYARSSIGGQSASVRLQSVFRGIRWQAEHSYFDNFGSEATVESSLTGDLAHETSVITSGLLPFVRNTPFSLGFERLENEEGESRLEWDASVTKNIRRLRLTSTVSQRIEDDRDRETDYILQVSSRIRNLNLRGSIGYEIEPDAQLGNVSLAADWRFDPRTTLRAAYRRFGTEDSVNALTLGASRRFDALQLGLSTTYQDDGEFRALLGTSFSLGYDPYRDGVFLREERMAQRAMHAPRVFYDKNNNSVFDADDEWMEDILFTGRGFDRTVATNAEGYALLPGVEPYRRATLEVNTSSLPDPYMRSVVPPLDYVLRPGQVVQTEFPIVLVGEVESDITYARSGYKRPAQSITLQVINPETGELVQESKSEFDGFAWVQDVPVGSYIARLDQTQIKELGYCMPADQTAEISVDEPFYALDAFFLWPKALPQNTSIVLASSTEADVLIAQWDKLRPMIEEIILDRSDYVDSYIIAAEGEDKHLILHDIAVDKAQSLCAQLNSQGAPCDVISPADKVCAPSIIEIKQLGYVSKEVAKQADSASAEPTDS